MNERTGQTMAEGWWCETCEVYEHDDDVDTTREVCIACGCNGAAHIPAQVVAK